MTKDLALGIIVIGSLAHAGCYTYGNATRDELIGGYPDSDAAVRITLNDGTMIESPAYLHLVVNKPTEIVSGVGRERVKLVEFKGVIHADDADSVREISTREGRFLVCWLKNNTSVGFRIGEYIRLSAEDPAGFWCAGKKIRSGMESPFRGAVTAGEIARIEIDRFDIFKTALLFSPIPLYFLFVETVRLIGGLGYHER